MMSAPWYRHHDISTPWYRHKNNITLQLHEELFTQSICICDTHMYEQYFLKGVVVMLSHMLWTWIAQMVTHQSRLLHSSPSISLMCNCRPLKVSDNKQLFPIPDICHFFYTGRIFLDALASLASTPVSQSHLQIFTLSASLDRHRASVDHRTSYIFWKLWPAAFRFWMGGQKTSTFAQLWPREGVYWVQKKLTRSFASLLR